ncbi:MAG: hypothetical protein HFG49_13445 [Lachnospiraceae bacterium]|jgi:hypothetical protein|nr:hypothetical protein [Lachnospiraceae bacterium]
MIFENALLGNYETFIQNTPLGKPDKIRAACRCMGVCFCLIETEPLRKEMFRNYLLKGGIL